MLKSSYESNEAFRFEIVHEAKRWVGTPYIHQASVPGQGADCLGFIRGVWRKCIGDEPQSVPAYSRDWGEVSGDETMLETAHKWFIPVEISKALAGDLVVFRWTPNSIAKHVGILLDNNHFIHAYEKSGIVETTLGSHWRNRIAATFRFPNPHTKKQRI